jgi:hypothetical protein
VSYYFDTRDGSEFIRDDEGLELAGSEAVRLEATRGLADGAKDAIPGATRRKLSWRYETPSTIASLQPLFGWRSLSSERTKNPPLRRLGRRDPVGLSKSGNLRDLAMWAVALALFLLGSVILIWYCFP